MENFPCCPACGAPSTVSAVDGVDGVNGIDSTVEVRCVAHHLLVGPRDVLAPKLRWDLPAQRVPMREELFFAPTTAQVLVHLG